MDEEQESSYESERAPCYHARDIARYRSMTEGCHLVLGSATPTVETAWYAKNGDYHLALLRERYNRRQLPEVILADMRQELRQGNLTAISQPLYQELKANLERGEQSILFLNRRGSSRQLLCPNCSFVPQCPRCSVYLTYHSANHRLMCHYCGYSKPKTDVCSECGSNKMKFVGIPSVRRRIVRNAERRCGTSVLVPSGWRRSCGRCFRKRRCCGWMRIRWVQATRLF